MHQHWSLHIFLMSATYGAGGLSFNPKSPLGLELWVHVPSGTVGEEKAHQGEPSTMQTLLTSHVCNLGLLLHWTHQFQTSHAFRDYMSLP